MMQLNGCHVLVLGMGRSGCAAASLLMHRGAKVVAADAKMDALAQSSAEIASLQKQGVQLLSDSAVDVSTVDLVVTSPGICPTHPVLTKARELGIPCLGEIELALRSLPKEQRILGITGTNGKTTVTLMVAHVLNACGIPAKAVGNVGVALCGEIDRGIAASDLLVMELSSYQLEHLHEPVIDAAVLLNITPDHLDRHGTMDGYALAKLGIARCLKPRGVLFVHEQVAQEFFHLLKDLPVRVYGGAGTHDVDNEKAAALLCASLGVTDAQFKQAVATFRKPPHRIEFVRRLGGVDFYDDSKGTNIDAVVKAVSALPGNLVLIVGGVDKGASYAPWLTRFANKVRAIYAIGQAAANIQREIGGQIPVTIERSLKDAVRGAAAVARPGETVLLSPGCSSFDMFRDYVHRGEEFKKIVSELSEVGEKR